MNVLIVPGPASGLRHPPPGKRPLQGGGEREGGHRSQREWGIFFSLFTQHSFPKNLKLFFSLFCPSARLPGLPAAGGQGDPGEEAHLSSHGVKVKNPEIVKLN